MKDIYFMLTHHYYIYVFVPYVCVCVHAAFISQLSDQQRGDKPCQMQGSSCWVYWTTAVHLKRLYNLFPHYTSSVFQCYVMLLCRLLFISLGHIITYDTPMLVLLLQSVRCFTFKMETLEKKLREFVVNIPRGRLASTQGGSRARNYMVSCIKTSINYFYCILNCWKMYLYISVSITTNEFCQHRLHCWILLHQQKQLY